MVHCHDGGLAPLLIHFHRVTKLGGTIKANSHYQLFFCWTMLRSSLQLWQSWSCPQSNHYQVNNPQSNESDPSQQEHWRTEKSNSLTWKYTNLPEVSGLHSESPRGGWRCGLSTTQHWLTRPSHQGQHQYDVTMFFHGSSGKISTDNTIRHWTRWCPVPLIVALSILRPARWVDNIGQLAWMGVKHAVTCTLVLASFRRLLRQEGAFLHQKCSDPKDVLWWITTLHEMVATDSHIELGCRISTRTWAMGCCSLFAQKVSIEKVLPLDYSTILLPPLVGVCSVPVSPNAQVAVLPLQSPILSASRELERTGTNMESNVQLRLTRCSCGECHMCVTACRELVKGDALVPATGRNPQIIVQFDGSAHRTSQVGGAGAALLQFDGNGLALLDWDARVLPKCADNIVAEANGADLAMHLYEKYVRMCHEQSLVSLPLSRIHGDIKQLLHHLDFRSRFRRSDLITLINTFHRRRSRAAPNAITEYRPRETNVISDYLAGQASAWILANPHDSRCSGEPFSIPIDPPYELLLEANAVILGPHVTGKVMLILQEMLGSNQLQLAACLRWNNGSHAAAIRSLALATRNVTTPLTVEYLTSANDASGRLYATQICAQRLPRELRLLIYGSTHKEVDLTGAHYELIRAMTGSVTLPPTRLLRGRLRETWAGDQVADPELSLDEVKTLPIRVMKSGAARALKHVTDKGLGIPAWIEAFAFDLEAARDVFTVHVRREVRPRVEALAKNRHFFAALFHLVSQSPGLVKLPCALQSTGLR